MSLFHHFAADNEIINLIYKNYMTAKEQNKLLDNPSVRNMPQFILCPDDATQYIALNLAMLS
jgi:hypothetical protein